MSFERRTFLGDVEFRKGTDGKLRAGGFALRYNTLSQNLGGFVEQVARGAVTKTIQEADIRGLVNHDPNLLIGRNTSGTLRLTDDPEGLIYEIDLPDTTVGRDAAVLLERKDMSGSSFGFRTIEDEWGETGQGFPLRTLKVIALRDVGPVTFPAYTEADAAMRSLAESRSLDIKELIEASKEDRLQEVLSRSSEKPIDEAENDRAKPIVVHRFEHLI